MRLLMSVLYWATFSSAVLALVAALLPVARARLAVVGRWATVASAITAVAGFLIRWYLAGHPAIFGTFENTYALATALMVSAAVAAYVRPQWAGLWRWAAPWAVASLLYGSRFRSETVPLTISEQSLWVEVHVAFAWIALISLLAATTASGIRVAGRRPLGMPDDAVDRFVSECLMAGFCGLTAMLATGSWYSFILFGEFWQWSIVETLSLSAWLAYALVLHARLFYRWGGRRLDVVILLVLPVLIAAYFIWSVYPDTWHFFDIPLMKPY